MKKDKKRIHCSNEKFLEAVYSSKTYAEVSSKTGQRITSTMARYSRIKKKLSKKNIKLPRMERMTRITNLNDVDDIVNIINKLKAQHFGTN
mgnify:FL=1|jgi:hypothetical protein